MADLVEPLIRQGWVTADAVQGCTEEELAALMEAQGVVALPGSYREFMGFTGRAPYWLARSEWDYEWLLEAKQIARQIVVEDYKGDFAPFEDAFVFQTHYGYEFYYFRAEDLTDPDPHFWIHSATKPVQESETSFATWLQELADYLPHAIELRRWLHRSSRA